jgi:hypothetical protein
MKMWGLGRTLTGRCFFLASATVDKKGDELAGNGRKWLAERTLRLTWPGAYSCMFAKASHVQFDSRLQAAHLHQPTVAIGKKERRRY